LTVPTISRFYGIVIAMYFGDHAPPHVHARYGGHKGRIAIRPGDSRWTATGHRAPFG
jgi:hypothetical protein